MNTLYRYEIEYSNADNPETKVNLIKYSVIRETEHSYFIKRYTYGSIERRITKKAYNTFAYDSKKAAYKHFIRRTQKRIDWYDYWTEECKKALKQIKNENLDN